MAHHQKHHTDSNGRNTAMQSLLKMFTLSNAPTVPLGEEDAAADADEPPDDQVSPLQSAFQKEGQYSRTLTKPQNPRRESLLTRAIMGDAKHEEAPSTRTSSRGMSTTSSHSAASMASTAELTSDGDLTSPTRSATPSPPPPTSRYAQMLASKKVVLHAPSIVIAPVTTDDKPALVTAGEAAVEKTLGRKRCIMFACGNKTSDSDKSSEQQKTQDTQPPKRKSMLTFACPSRKDTSEKSLAPPKRSPRNTRRPSPAPASKRRLSADYSATGLKLSIPAETETISAEPVPTQPATPSPQPFHEFASSQSEPDTWVTRPEETDGEKMTLEDCMKKENAIRRLGEEAEQEAEEEEREQENLDNDYDDIEGEDDFAPSDESDAGNESDDEGGFADSDDESDADSEYQFWAPSTSTGATSAENINISHFSARQRSRASSIESTSTPPLSQGRATGRRRFPKALMKPGTPELPDSTDFVCGTLDEDRPLEAAYISCRERKRNAKHIPIPQDVDPTFPTTDPDDNDNSDEEDNASVDGEHPLWMREQFTGFEEEGRGRRGSPARKVSLTESSPPKEEYPFPLTRRSTNRSPPPPKRGNARSPPPPRKLFGHSPPARLRSPAPRARLHSPPGSPINRPAVGFGNLLGQRPRTERTSSLPKTPNPFFTRFNIGSPSISNVASGAVTPAVEEPPRSDLHVRGPVDIVIGLEKKRQKRKEKYWRQHCRKNAKEQQERRPATGRGVERMRELGLECAERTRGYGTGQQTQLVISL